MTETLKECASLVWPRELMRGYGPFCGTTGAYRNAKRAERFVPLLLINSHFCAKTRREFSSEGPVPGHRQARFQGAVEIASPQKAGIAISTPRKTMGVRARHLHQVDDGHLNRASPCTVNCSFLSNCFAPTTTRANALAYRWPRSWRIPFS